MGEIHSKKKFKNFKIDTFNITLLGILTAIVILLQTLGANIRFGPFSVTLVLLPIVIGAALIHPLAGGWLGLVFGVIVLLTDASAFLAINIIGTVVTVLLKGTLAGIAAGYVYRLIAKHNRIIATFAAVITPIVNTGVFIAGTYIFFLPTIKSWALEAGFANATTFIFIVLVGWNFVLEFAVNLVLSPTITFLIQYGRKRKRT